MTADQAMRALKQAMRALKDAQCKIDQRERRLLRLADKSASIRVSIYPNADISACVSQVANHSRL